MDTVIRFHAYGDDVLRVETRPEESPAAGEVRILHGAIGVNFVDVYLRKGLHKMPELPAVPGVEAVGLVEAVGADVIDLKVGDRVVYAAPPGGAYASARNLAAARVVRVDAPVPDDSLAAAFFRGLTVHMLFHSVRKIQRGETVLIHAAAGGLGLLLVQWAKSLGARTIGTVGSADKAKLALAHGLDHAILYREQDFISETLSLTSGRGVDYAIDGIGGSNLFKTTRAVRPFGMVASIGLIEGSMEKIDPAFIAPNVAVSFPSVIRFLSDLKSYREAAVEVLERLSRSELKISIADTIPLANAAEAHRRLEGRGVAGALILKPSR